MFGVSDMWKENVASDMYPCLPSQHSNPMFSSHFYKECYFTLLPTTLISLDNAYPFFLILKNYNIKFIVLFGDDLFFFCNY